jgi:nucleoside-diphosphate-sugar epimerase
MTRILITGAGSFIGRNFLKYSAYKQVKEFSLIENPPSDIDFSEVDVVIHLAAIVHQTKKIDEQQYFRINTDLCLKVADLAKKRGVKQFIYLSSIKVYGAISGSSITINENSECHPDDAYGKSKYAAEAGLQKMNDDNFIVSIIRTPLVYGEGVKANMYSLIRLVDLLPFLPFGKVKNRRNFTFAGNLVGYIDRIIELKAPGIYIAMDEKALSLTELVGYISECLGKKKYLFRLPGIIKKGGQVVLPGIFERLFDSLVFDNSQTKRILDYEPPYSIEDGIRTTVNHYLQIKKGKDSRP